MFATGTRHLTFSVLTRGPSVASSLQGRLSLTERTDGSGRSLTAPGNINRGGERLQISFRVFLKAFHQPSLLTGAYNESLSSITRAAELLHSSAPESDDSNLLLSLHVLHISAAIKSSSSPLA